MITEKDLREAIAECQGERNPDAKTCMKLAAFYIILDHINEKAADIPAPTYSYDSPPVVQSEIINYKSNTEFAELVDGRDINDILPIMEELVEVVRKINPRLYAGVVRRLEE